jgi:hypothetical protein
MMRNGASLLASIALVSEREADGAPGPWHALLLLSRPTLRASAAAACCNLFAQLYPCLAPPPHPPTHPHTHTLKDNKHFAEPVPLGQRFAADVAADVKHAAPLATLMNMVQWACLVRCCLPQDTRKMLTSVSMHACHSAT